MYPKIYCAVAKVATIFHFPATRFAYLSHKFAIPDTTVVHGLQIAAASFLQAVDGKRKTLLRKGQHDSLSRCLGFGAAIKRIAARKD